MRSRYAVLLGLAFGLVLLTAIVVGVLARLPVVVAVAAGGLGVAILTVQIDTWRRTRSLRNFVRDEIRSASRDDVGSRHNTVPVTADDVTGAVRILQAQYTARLDRMQDALEEFLAAADRGGAPEDRTRTKGEE